MVLEGDNTDKTKKILSYFEKNSEKIFTPKDLEKASGLGIKNVRGILQKLLKQEKIIRVSRGKYRYPKAKKTLSKEDAKRYLSALEKTCEIAIHELMLTEPFVGKEERPEIEHQIAYFARYLVKARWELEHGSGELAEMEEAAFKRARKIHEWHKFIFERSLAKKK
ncbi:MAG: hypothetical protein JSV56_13765 [Methanomassiliicoccales archaeon]|nr:MAG: hypothetical protein JSV56_13765 [Methanomassiliicoccales archaeon]